MGVLHVGALPGAPEAHLSLDAIVEAAVAEARVYREAGFNALAIENTHDRPYVKGRAGPETVAGMTAVGREVRRAVPLPLGVCERDRGGSTRGRPPARAFSAPPKRSA